MKNKISMLMLKPKTVNVLFMLLIASLPFVNKFSKLIAVLFLIVFFKFIYENRDFILPSMHKLFVYSFFALIALSNILAGTMLQNLKQDFYLAIFILIYYATNYFIQKKILTLSTIVYAILISMTIYMLDGYYQYFVGYDLFFQHPFNSAIGITGISQNRNLFAFASLFYFVVLLFLALEKKEKSFWVYILLLSSAILILLTFCRQIWLSMIAITVIVGLFKYHSFSLKYFLAAILSIVVMVLILFNVPELHHRLVALEEMHSSGRIEYWKLLIPHISEAPIFGHGLQSPIRDIALNGKYFDYAHNLTLGILYSLGIAGFVFYIVFIYYFLRILIQCKNKILKPYFFATFIALMFIQQQVGGSMLIHKFIGPSIMIFLALVTSYCSSETFVKKGNLNP
ncbi:O-antigen ligase [Sulfurovum sp.]|uniref:O-antigen ligase family protein n=2 Tax=Sulfurovum sp. TaxID=1969726 RepID=UPI0025F1B7A1|nr:O-antigen ligase family protein [Sulfurovum sp.]